MGRGINRVTLIGNLGTDPEVRYTPQGVAIANLTVATGETWTDKNTNEKKEHTEWHRVVIYQRLAEVAGEYLRKGSKVYIEGKLKTRKWTDQQGIDRWMTEIICSELQMLDGRESSTNQAPPAQQQRPAQQQHQPQSNNRQPPPPGYSGTMPQQPPPPINFDEDDIPF